jgi:coenzyme F420-0:L-glutamate ligase/coenzyme F420-1:gamma-L-glutamate ligase
VTPGPAPARLTVVAVRGIGEIGPGDDLAGVLAAALGRERLPGEGDVVVVTSKVVSKAEGKVVAGDREPAVHAETDRVVAVRGTTRIVRNRLGLVMAAAGVDASNTAPGTVVLLPADPDASARRLRDRLGELTGRNVAVLVSDTAGRAWRNGQTDIAVGVAGLEPLHDLSGRSDRHGNPLAVTAPAVADEVAAAADLVKGKLAGTPAAVVTGLAHLVLPPGAHGPGARALVREEEADLFGLGAREAVLAAVRRADPGPGGDVRGFGSPAGADEVSAILAGLPGGSGAVASEDGALRVRVAAADPFGRGMQVAGVLTAAYAVSWRAAEVTEESLLLRPAVSPGP